MNIKLSLQQIKWLQQYPAFRDAEPPFIVRVDPSTLANAYCLRAIEWQNLIGLTKKVPDHIATYGSAVHLAIANRRKGSKIKACISEAVDYFMNSGCDPKLDWRTESHLMTVLSDYFVQYNNDPFVPLSIDGADGTKQYCVEHQFMIPDFVDCGDITFALTGAIDAVGKMHSPIEICDIKCTATWNARDFLAKYRHSHQMMLYSYAIRRLGLVDYYPPCFIDGIFLQSAAPFVRFERSGAYDFTPDNIQTTVDWAQRKCMEIAHEIQCISEIGKSMQRNPSACELYNGCQFTTLCWGDPIMQKLERGAYKQRLYDPANFGKSEADLTPP